MLQTLLIQQALIASLNRVFAQTPGARAALARHAGKTLALDFLLARICLRIEADGSLRTNTAATPDAVVFIDPGLISQLPFKGKAAFREARTEGDAELLSAFNDAFSQISLDAEAELANMFGPVAGFRLAEAGRAFGKWVAQASTDTAKTLAEYAVEESPMLASKLDVERFNHEVDALRDDMARLEARLAQLVNTEKFQRPNEER